MSELIQKFQKLKHKTIKEVIKAVSFRLFQPINNTLFRICYLLPINNDLMIMESEGDLSDNSFALYDYMNKNGYLKKYKVIWAVDDVKKSKEQGNDHLGFIKKKACFISIKRAKYLATCKWYIYDHTNLIKRKREGQTIVYLSHGVAFKKRKGNFDPNQQASPNYIFATGPLPAEKLSKYWKEPLEKVIILGYPRIDYLLINNEEVKYKINRKWHFYEYNKVFFWMPTFRQCNDLTLSEEYISNQTGLPLFSTLEDLRNFSTFLKEMEVLMVFKVHHLQAELPVFMEKIDNIIIVHDEELKNMGIQLYQFLAYSDALISDYSSAPVDYLVMDRPLVYILDDYEQYNKSRGLNPPDAKKYMPGYHVVCVDELRNAMRDICIGKDEYREKRKEILPIFHKYTDSNSSMRIVKFLNI